MKHSKLILTLVVVALLPGCANRMVGKSKSTKVDEQVVTEGMAHDRPLCLLTSPMPEGVEYEHVADSKANSKHYGSDRGLRDYVFDEARKLGGDVVYNWKSWQRVSFWAWAAPAVSASIARLKDRPSFDCLKHGGKLV